MWKRRLLPVLLFALATLLFWLLVGIPGLERDPPAPSRLLLDPISYVAALGDYKGFVGCSLVVVVACGLSLGPSLFPQAALDEPYTQTFRDRAKSKRSKKHHLSYATLLAKGFGAGCLFTLIVMFCTFFFGALAESLFEYVTGSGAAIDILKSPFLSLFAMLFFGVLLAPHYFLSAVGFGGAAGALLYLGAVDLPNETEAV